MLDGLAALVQRLHAGGRVHRDLKPDNALLLLNTASWCLLDLGIVSQAGALLLHLLSAEVSLRKPPTSEVTGTGQCLFQEPLWGLQCTACRVME